jgi:hypothetical protein
MSGFGKQYPSLGQETTPISQAETELIVTELAKYMDAKNVNGGQKRFRKSRRRNKSRRHNKSRKTKRIR